MTTGEIIPVELYDYLIFRHDSRFKVKSGLDGTTLYETSDLTDAYPAFDYCKVAMGNTGKSTHIKSYGHANWYPLSQAVGLDSASYQYQFWTGTAGPRGTGSHVRVSNNTPAFLLTGGAIGNIIGNLYLTHDRADYSTHLIHFLDRAIENTVIGCRFYDNNRYLGNAIGMEILGTGSGLSQYKNKIINCLSTGFESFKFYNNNKVTSGSDYFISNNSIVDTEVWDSKHVIKSVGVAGGAQILDEVLENVSYQYKAANPLVSGEAVFELGEDPWQSLWKFTDVMVWDIPAGVNFANVNTATELELKGCYPSWLIGGSGASLNPLKVRRFDWYTMAKGEELKSSTLTRDYTITHNLGKTPQHVFVTAEATDFNIILPYSIISKTTTQFIIRFPRLPPLPNISGANNLKFTWMVLY